MMLIVVYLFMFVGLFVIHIYVLNSLWTIAVICLYSEIGLVMYNNNNNDVIAI